MFRINKKLVISIVFAAVLLIGGILGFVVIPNQINKFRPPSDSPTVLGTVSGNGGSAVMVGGYLYFTSGFVSNSEETLSYKQNEYNKVHGEGSIWRVKMGNGTPYYDNTYLENWDEYKGLTQNEIAAKYGDALDKQIRDDDFKLIVPKIAGWEKTALWVFGDTLIYTSPNNQKNKYNQLQREKIDFFSVNLRGLNHKKLYTTHTEEVALDDFTVVCVDNKIYLLCDDGGTLVRVDMNGRVQTISTKINYVALPIVSSYDNGVRLENGQLILSDDSQSLKNSYSENMEYIYYVESIDSESVYTGTTMMRYNIKTGEKETLRHDNTSQQLIALANGSLVFENWLDNETKKLYIVDQVLPANMFNQNLENFLVQQNLHPEEADIFIPGERTSRENFFFIAKGANNTISKFSKANNFQPISIPGINDAEEIIAVTASTIMYKSTEATGEKMVTCNISGDNRVTADAPKSAASEARLTTFNIIDELGGYLSNLGPMFFYIKEISQQDGNGSDVMTVAAFMNSKGKEFILARLADKFIPAIPENE